VQVNAEVALGGEVSVVKWAESHAGFCEGKSEQSSRPDLAGRAVALATSCCSKRGVER
jgi:hypothetical protein